MAINNSSNIPSTSGTAVVGTGTGFSTVAYSATSSASSLAQRDANSNLTANSIIQGYATTATAAGTTTLTVSSAPLQYFTGSTTQTVVMPVTSTLVLGQTFTIVNNSSGVVTVQSSGANTIQAMAASTQLVLTVILTSGTSAASWNAVYGPISNTGGIPSTATSNQILQSVASSSPVWSTATFPGTTTANQILYSSATNTVTGLATANNRVLVTSGAGVPSLATTLPTAVQQTITNFGSSLTSSGNSAGTNSINISNLSTTANNGSRVFVSSTNTSSLLATSWILLASATSSPTANAFSIAVDNATNQIFTRTGQPYGATGDVLQTLDANGNLAVIGTFTLGNSTSALPATGIITFNGGVSGQSTISVPANAGAVTFTLPTTEGTAGQALLSDGGSNTGYTWGDVALVSATTTWTPGIAFGGGTTGITYTTQSGQYTALGNLVYFTCNIVLSNKGSSTGAVTITGLPVNTSAASSDNALSINNFGNLTLSVGNTLVSGVFSASGSTISLQQTSLTGTLSNLSDTNFANTSQLTFSGFYFTS